MKTFKIITMTALLCSAIATTRAQTNAYTGNWKRNDAQTDPEALSINSVPESLKITADNKAVYVDATMANSEGKVHHLMDTLKLDGSINSFLTPNGTKKQTSLSWSADKTRFTGQTFHLDEVFDEQ
jgi:hypothetical protein